MLPGKPFQTSVKRNNLAASSRLNFSTRRSEFGDDLDDAKDLGTLRSGNSRSFSGDVGGRDLDFFKFDFNNRGRFTARLKNDSDGNQPIAMTVLDSRGRGVRGSNGKFLFANVRAGRTFTLGDSRLRSGTYYLRLQSRAGKDEDYDLEINAGSSSSGGGGSLDNARNLGSISLGQSRSGGGTVGSSDTDLYQFGISGTSRMVFRLTNNSFSDPIALTVLDAGGNTIRKDNGGLLFVNADEGDTRSLIAPTLRSGTYYMRFTSQNGDDESYNFRVTRSASTSPV